MHVLIVCCVQTLTLIRSGSEDVFQLDFTSHIQGNETENHLINDAGFSSHSRPTEAKSPGLRRRNLYFYQVNQIVLRKSWVWGLLCVGLTDTRPAGREALIPMTQIVLI